MKSSSESSPPPLAATFNKAYPWLLGVSVCFSGLLCWLYVTKPVQIISGESSAADQEEAGALSGVSSSADRGLSAGKHIDSQLVPSDDALPGVVSTGGGKGAGSPDSAAGKGVDPRKIIALGDGSGWETTNSRVQHILNADAGNGDNTKIVLNVPVLYQTRTMRWTPTDVQKARDILTRMMVYEGNLSKVKQEGHLLLLDWNRLLEKTVPAASLRADSPSLPYNHSQRSGRSSFSGNDSTIKIEP